MISEIIKKLNNSQKELIASIDIQDKMIIIILKGQIDTYNNIFFTNAIDSIIELKKYDIIVFNMEYLNYVSSTGVGSFICIYEKLCEENVKLFLLNINNKTYEVFQLLGFASFFNIIKNISDVKNINKAMPFVAKCPICGEKIKVIKSGTFKCSSCNNNIKSKG